MSGDALHELVCGSGCESQEEDRLRPTRDHAALPAYVSVNPPECSQFITRKASLPQLIMWPSNESRATRFMSAARDLDSSSDILPGTNHSFMLRTDDGL